MNKEKLHKFIHANGVKIEDLELDLRVLLDINMSIKYTLIELQGAVEKEDADAVSDLLKQWKSQQTEFNDYKDKIRLEGMK